MRRNRRAGVEDRWQQRQRRAISPVRDRETVDGMPCCRVRPGTRKVVRPQGRCTAVLDEATAAVLTGQYVDPKAGQVTFADYADRWRQMQVCRPSSVAHVETMLRRHAYPTLGGRSLTAILPNDIQSWVKSLNLAPATVGVVHGLVSTVMKAAIRDRGITSNPCDGTKLPKVARPQIVPLTTEQVTAVRDALPAELAALVTLAAGTGMRQGECFGLTVDRTKFLERTVVVDRQLVTLPKQAPVLPRLRPRRATEPSRCPRWSSARWPRIWRHSPLVLTAWCSHWRVSPSGGRRSGTSGGLRSRRPSCPLGPGSTRCATTTPVC